MSTTFLSPTDSPTAFFTSEKIGKFGYGIGISVGILLLITTITLLSYFCTRFSSSSANPASRSRHDDEADDNDVEAGVDEATLKSWAKVSYAEAKRRDPRVAGEGCSVCLGDYGEEDVVLRMLPECGHLFHATCVDPWLRRKPSCPVCRSSPVVSPVTTPLVEVVPLVATR